MIAPSYWVDPKSGNNYFVTVQYPENQVNSHRRSEGHAAARAEPEAADVSESSRRREHRSSRPPKWITISCNEPSTCMWRPPEKISASRRRKFRRSSPIRNFPPNIRINMRGLVITMQSSFRSFGFGLVLVHSAGLSGSGRAVFFVHRSLSDRSGRSHGTGRRDAHAGVHGHDAQHSIADGNRDAARNGGVQQHPDRGFCESSCAAKAATCAKRWPMPAASVCGRF